MVRNRAGFGSGLIRFWFDFGSLRDVGLEGVVRAVRFWFDFGSGSCRFWFTRPFTADEAEYTRNHAEGGFNGEARRRGDA
jgi:hypothetical protein